MKTRSWVINNMNTTVAGKQTPNLKLSLATSSVDLRSWTVSPVRACALCPGPAAGMRRLRRGSVRPELPVRTVTMSFPTGPTENRNRARSSRRTAADPERHRLRPPAAGCPGEREGWWRRRTLFWRTSSGAPVVSPLFGLGGQGGLEAPDVRMDPPVLL